MHDISIERLRTMCGEDRIKWTTHALARMRERKISSETIINTILSGEIIKQYQDDRPHPSCLIFNNDFAFPLHVVASTDDENIFIITTYLPTLDEWQNDYKTRRETE